jgi:2-succinyl-6-hydroxy-2,4-cyclohexadiene-1-carboxylate synthase
MPTANINGIDIYYERHGDAGEPLVLVHGYTGDVSDWRHQVPEFARTHRVLIMDHRGHGRSHAPADRGHYTIDAMADDVEALAALVGFDRYHLLGHSMGGAVVQEIALRSPGRLLSLTLHDTTYRFGTNTSEVMRRYLEERHRVAEEQGMAAVAEIPPIIAPPPHMPAERLAEAKLRLARMSVDAFIGAWHALYGWAGTEDRAQKIAAPTLVVYGELDAAFVEPAGWFGANIPQVTVEMIAECGHSPQFERPTLFNTALRAHLARHAGGAAK